MRSKLNEMKNGGDVKIKPIINSRSFTTTANSLNNTALYFKTDMNYYFLCVNDDVRHLEVTRVPIKTDMAAPYLSYLNFGPKPLQHCPSFHSYEQVDSNAAVRYDKEGDSSTSILDGRSGGSEDGASGMNGPVTKSTIPCSPTTTSTDGANGGNSSLPRFDSSTLKLQKTGSGSDSGVDTKSPDGQEGNSIGN